MKQATWFHTEPPRSDSARPSHLIATEVYLYSFGTVVALERGILSQELKTKNEDTMKAFASALTIAVAFAFFGTTTINACGGMTTVNPPPLTLDDPPVLGQIPGRGPLQRVF